MKINFDILDSEADIIAAQYAYDGKTNRDEFVLEQFKKFGRTCILSDEERKSSITLEQAKKDILEAKIAAISF